MIILLIVETSLIVFFLVASGLSKQSFPALHLSLYFTPGCSTLTARIVSTTTTNRTVYYSCGSHPAIITRPVFFSTSASSNPAGILVAPDFALPPGYLKLSLVESTHDIGSGLDCLDQAQIQLGNGQDITLGGSQGVSYNYCSAISGATGPIDGFTITWNEVPWPGICCVIYATPSHLTIPPGQNGTSLLMVTALNSFRGEVSLGGYGIGGSGYNWYYNPPKIFLKPNSSNTTTIIVSILADAPPQTRVITIIAANYYGFYHDGRFDLTITIP